MTNGHVTLVTGAGSGIGAAVARRLGAAGTFVHLVGRNEERLQRIQAEIQEAGGRAGVVVLDVTDGRAIAAEIARISRVEPVDRLVACAGVAVSAPLSAEHDALHQLHLDVNYHGSRRVFEALLPGMIEQGGGHAVFVASSAALVGYAYVAAYCASKHAILGYARAAAVELEKKGVRVGVVCPWYVDSAMTDASAERIASKTGRSVAEAREGLARQNPGGRLLTPEEVAEVVCELLESPATGAVIEMDGKARRDVAERR
jgi:NAD(P)-dependent dehydrogenase (short-subunit alcohol dehydrogenase family)